MSTKYYLETQDYCHYCRKFTGKTLRLLIGEASAGWCFKLNKIKSRKLNSLRDWLIELSDGTIFDEYGKAVSVESLFSLILSVAAQGVPWEERFTGPHTAEEAFHFLNSSARGPHNLLASVGVNFETPNPEGYQMTNFEGFGL